MGVNGESIFRSVRGSSHPAFARLEQTDSHASLATQSNAEFHADVYIRIHNFCSTWFRIKRTTSIAIKNVNQSIQTWVFTSIADGQAYHYQPHDTPSRASHRAASTRSSGFRPPVGRRKKVLLKSLRVRVKDGLQLVGWAPSGGRTDVDSLPGRPARSLCMRMR